MQNRLRERREALGLRRERVAADADMTVQHLRLLERGMHRPSLDLSRRLAHALGTTVDDLFPPEALTAPVAAELVAPGSAA